MSYQMTFEDIHRSIYSPALEDGATRCDLLDGQMIAPSGLVAVHANHSAMPESDWEQQTSGTSGRSCESLSPSARLQLSLENRLRARMDVNGSLEYALTWKHWDMLSGVPICALRASAHRTFVHAYSGVPPTLTAKDYRHGMSSRCLEMRKSHPRGVNLNEFMQRALGFPGKINPEFARLWMGYPVEWGFCGATAMQSCHKSRRNSSKLSRKQ